MAKLLEIQCTSFSVRAARGGGVIVEFDDVGAADVIEALGEGEILDVIGEKKCIEYFDIETTS